MKNPTGRREAQWFWLGVILLSVSAFIWLMDIKDAIVDPEIDLNSLIIGGAFTTFILIGLGIYCLKRGSKRAIVASQKRSPSTIECETKSQSVSSSETRVVEEETHYTHARAIDDLCEHLRRMGLNASVESRKRKWLVLSRSLVIGSVRVVNRNIDLLELELHGGYADEYSFESPAYRCNYLVQAEVEGLEDKLWAELKAVRKSFSKVGREVVGFEWKGLELAQALSGDAILGDMLYRLKNTVSLPIEIRPNKKHKCIRIRRKYGAYSPAAVFPSIEVFEAFDRIAMHTRSIAARAKGTKNG